MFFVYINLFQRKLKNRHMTNMLRSLNLEFERFDAIRPELNDALNISKLVPRIANYLSNETQIPRGLGVIGCYYSHLNVLKKYRNINKKYLCILEDDICIDALSIKSINKLIEKINNENLEWDIIRSLLHVTEFSNSLLEYKNTRIFKFKAPNRQSIYNIDPEAHRYAGGAHLQIINVKNIEKIIEYIESDYIYNIDSLYSTDKINIYAVKDRYFNIKHPQNLRRLTNIPKV